MAMIESKADTESGQDTVKIITEFLAPELAQVQQILSETLDSESRLIREVGHFIGLARGKKLRPMITLLTARALAPAIAAPIGVATSLELIHVATLIHDDVIDKAATRRGQPSVNARWGDDVAILMADFLYARAFDLALGSLRPECLKLICNVTQRMCEGEMFQIELREQELTPEDYMLIVERKTGQLFHACAALGAMVAGRSEAEIRAVGEYGRAFGIAFQITDDTLDYIARDERWGKEIGMDVSGGKQTLPLLLALAEASAEDRANIHKHMNNGRDFNAIMETIQRYSGVDRSVEQAREFAQRAADHLNAVRPGDALAFQYLQSLPQYVLGRLY